MVTTSLALQEYLRPSTCGLALQYCRIFFDTENIIIDCPDEVTSCFLSYQADELTTLLKRLTNKQGIIIMLKGDECDYLPLTRKSTALNMLASTGRQIINYPQLLDLVRYSEYPTYVTLLPRNWEWESPIRCILTSDKVNEYAGRACLDFHGADISLLYDRSDMEEQIAILMREFERNNGNAVRINNLSYYTYLSDTNRKTPQKDTTKRYEYNADFELMHIEGLGLVRICHCKDRRFAPR